MNIAAVMTALDLWDLDHNAKHALLVVACRVNHHSGRAAVAVPRVAADMKVSYKTALAALDRAVEAGYLNVDKSPGRTPVWRLTPVILAPTPVILDPNLGNLDAARRIRRIKKERAAAPLGQEPSGAAGENPTFAPGSGRLPNWSKGES
jgi:hypothetical protein